MGEFIHGRPGTLTHDVHQRNNYAGPGALDCGGRDSRGGRHAFGLDLNPAKPAGKGLFEHEAGEELND